MKRLLATIIVVGLALPIMVAADPGPLALLVPSPSEALEESPDPQPQQISKAKQNLRLASLFQSVGLVAAVAAAATFAQADLEESSDDVILGAALAIVGAALLIQSYVLHGQAVDQMVLASEPSR